MGLDATNAVFGAYDSEIQTMACSATETSWKNKILHEASSDMMLSNRRITKAQVSPFAVRTPGPEDKFSRIEDYIYENMLTPLHGLSVQRSNSKFWGTQNTYTSPCPSL